MIVEERIYTLHVGKVPEYLTSFYEAEGLAVQTRILWRASGLLPGRIRPSEPDRAPVVLQPISPTGRRADRN